MFGGGMQCYLTAYFVLCIKYFFQFSCTLETEVPKLYVMRHSLGCHTRSTDQQGSNDAVWQTTTAEGLAQLAKLPWHSFCLLRKALLHAQNLLLLFEK